MMTGLIYLGSVILVFVIAMPVMKGMFKTREEYLKNAPGIAIFVAIVWPFVLFYVLCYALIIGVEYLAKKFAGLFWKEQ